jgi:hypothetical protein
MLAGVTVSALGSKQTYMCQGNNLDAFILFVWHLKADTTVRQVVVEIHDTLQEMGPKTRVQLLGKEYGAKFLCNGEVKSLNKSRALRGACWGEFELYAHRVEMILEVSACEPSIIVGAEGENLRELSRWGFSESSHILH